MKIIEWLFDTMKRLGTAGVDAPRRDALVLLEDTLNKDRTWVLANPDHNIDKAQLEKLGKLIDRRAEREPLAYIRGRAWFYGRFFDVTPNVIVPRPETESFIELLREIRPKNIIDIGTGSGCLAITAKLELPDAEVTATDTSPKALKIARQNAKRHGVKIKFVEGSLLQPILSTNYKIPTTILANLPYVPDGLVTSPEISREPAEALFSGTDGLDHYRKLWAQAKKLSEKPQYILAESLETQHKDMAKLAQAAGYELQNAENLVQLFAKS